MKLVEEDKKDLGNEVEDRGILTDTFMNDQVAWGEKVKINFWSQIEKKKNFELFTNCK